MNYVEEKDHFKRNIIIIWSGIAIFLLIIHFTVFQPEYDKLSQEDKDIKIKTENEKNKIQSMDCKSLGNWLLTDNVYDHDNLVWAQNHYLVNCK